MVLINGLATREVDVADRGFQYGDGVFETIEVIRATPLFLPRHLERLRLGCAKLSIPFPGTETLGLEVEKVCGGCERGVLKIQVTRGVGGRGYRHLQPVTATRVLSLHPYPGYPENFYNPGVRVRMCETRLGCNPGIAGIKHMNRLEQVLGRQEWAGDEVQEGLMLDQDDYVVEGTMTNIFLVKDTMLSTPELDRCGVSGIMRNLVIENAKNQGIPLAIRRLTKDDVFAADEMFLTNSLIGCWPVRQLEDQIYPVGPVTLRVSQGIDELKQREWGAR